MHGSADLRLVAALLPGAVEQIEKITRVMQILLIAVLLLILQLHLVMVMLLDLMVYVLHF